MPAKHPDDFCPTCGSYTGPYEHGISKMLISALRKVYDHAGTSWTTRKEIEGGLTNNEWSNFQKLFYWTLVEREWDPVTQRFVRGKYRVSEYGEAFLQGRVAIREKAISQGGDSVGTKGELVYAHQVDVGCWEYEDYVQTRGTG